MQAAHFVQLNPKYNMVWNLWILWNHIMEFVFFTYKSDFDLRNHSPFQYERYFISINHALMAFTVSVF